MEYDVILRLHLFFLYFSASYGDVEQSLPIDSNFKKNAFDSNKEQNKMEQFRPTRSRTKNSVPLNHSAIKALRRYQESELQYLLEKEIENSKYFKAVDT